MNDVLLDELREIHHAERQAVRAYPKLAKAIRTESLRKAVEEHLEETRGQVERLERIFEDIDRPMRGRPCEAMRGLIEDAQDLEDRRLEPELMEVLLVAAMQKMEHFEIAAYGSAQAHAEAMGMGEAAKLLQQSLDEEKAMDRRLNMLAVNEVNRRALQLSEGEGGGSGVDRAAAADKPKGGSGGHGPKGGRG